MKRLDEIGSPATIANMGGRFFGGVVGGALPASVAAHCLADAWDQNACLFDFSPVSAYLEDIVLGWLLSLLGLPDILGWGLCDRHTDGRCYCSCRPLCRLRGVGWDGGSSHSRGCSEEENSPR